MNHRAFWTTEVGPNQMDQVAADATIHVVEADTAEAARDAAEAAIRASCAPDELAGVAVGDYGDCWVKFPRQPSADDFADGLLAGLAPFLGSELRVAGPGQHPGRRAWWITPHPDVLIPVWSSITD